MSKLRTKVFFTVFLILTLFLCSFTLLFNIQNYNQEKRAIMNSLDKVSNKNRKMLNDQIKNKSHNTPNIEDNIELSNPLLDENLRFMDSVIYTVLIDENNNRPVRQAFSFKINKNMLLLY